MYIQIWAQRWGIPQAAINDLRRELSAFLPADTKAPANVTPSTSEASVSANVRFEASQKGCRLWRNNIGAVTDVNGNFFRYGLLNDSKAINDKIKSSDLIGIRPVVLPSGGVIGQFMARECKAPGWRYSGTKREQAQLKFLDLVASMGGDAQFATGPGTI